MPAPEAKQIESVIVSLLEDLVEDWDLGLDQPIGPQTRLGEDLGLTSVDILNLFASVDLHFSRRLPYEHLVRRREDYRSELRVSELVDFVCRHFGDRAPERTAM